MNIEIVSLLHQDLPPSSPRGGAETQNENIKRWAASVINPFWNDYTSLTTILYLLSVCFLLPHLDLAYSRRPVRLAQASPSLNLWNHAGDHRQLEHVCSGE